MSPTQADAPSSNTGDVSPGGSGNPATNPKMRKRTKTGCLTCRKRRIKCGEERPTCANCIKSKRQCEGYNQRVVFKPPIGDWPNHPGVVSTLQYHNSMLPGSRASFRGQQPTAHSQDSVLSTIQPRPTQYDFSNIETQVPGLQQIDTQTVLVGGPQPYPQDANYQQPLQSPHHQQGLHSPHHQLPTPTSASYFSSQTSPVHPNMPGQYAQEGGAGFVPPYSQVDTSPITSSDQGVYQQPPSSAGLSQPHPYYTTHSATPSPTGGYTQFSDPRSSLSHIDEQSSYQQQQPPLQSPIYFSLGGSYAPSPALAHAVSQSSFQPVQIPHHDVHFDVKYMPHSAPVLGMSRHDVASSGIEPAMLLSGFGGDDHVSPTQVLYEAAVENEDDDYYDVQSDEEMLDREDKSDDAVMLSQDFSLIHRIQGESTSDLTVRSYNAFIYEGILTTYRAEYVANPLKNPKTARVFAHFIHVTGPSLSIYERNPRNPTSIFEGPVPPSQQSLWTYTLPLKALNNQGLLHAMLALASLHIAKLQRASVTPSYKHYAYALKRLGRSLGNPRRRLTIPTLATSMLLAFYEVMTAEHVKWSTHLVGAAQLISELDFRSLTREARRIRAAQLAEERQFPNQNPNMLIDQRQFEQKLLQESTMIPDAGLVSTIVGKEVNYDDFGRVFEEDAGVGYDGTRSPPSRPDLRSYETMQDLYWWYARHDMFQSIVSGNPLIMDYRKWSDCPPRAPLGRADALYGSHDHIILLIGRIADFTVRDRARKLAQQTANGGHWIPTPGMPGMGKPPGQAQGPGGPPPTPTTPMGPPPHMQGMAPSPPGGPGFYGMAPSRPNTSLPTTYANPEQASNSSSPRTPKSPSSQLPDLPAAMESAMAEWNSIAQAHNTIAMILTKTPAFQPLPSDPLPLPPDPQGKNRAPFGPPLIHRSYDISILWSLINLSQILLLRAHPTMPPAAMVAANVCAPATQPYAILIGRIASGMQMPTFPEASVTPALGAALIEITMSLFFAGVQYTDASQREWLITRLVDIDRRTGWASAGVVARAIETSWEKTGEMGRGPAYPNRITRAFGMDEEDSDEDGDGEGENAPSMDGNVGGEERRFVVRHRGGGLVPWAMNVLATDEDLRVGIDRMGIGGEINAAGTSREAGGS
ncbi:hypothetical protein BU24DRAFT_341519 [Aaosphaeria arxii CBS 175.79]|uniref:Zn(2)-C6 fungal-type domain-containing protein n=1 Tax=Aaosphaeria arxii CBS 175.79 TaxID=1450172 RepID=A0A6A5Y2Z6_9PLEO|nr:uncharacterized protein BU24DRAFT_341519 [Aaosphaeria arxii CBS 175.79]KAF2019271.1 hypothetical protein BU24DRAFT_341519 [Aaosphaeria arxii CBS 175.79]